MKKKVAIINSVCGFGSTGRIAQDSAHYFIDNGLEAHVFYGRKIGISDKKISTCFSSTFSVFNHIILSRVFDRSGFYSTRSTKKLIRMLDKFNPDIIFLHNLHGYYLNIRVFFDYLKSKRDVKIFWVFHDCWPFTGHCSHFENIGCENWISQCKKCPQLRSYPSSFFFDNSSINYQEKKSLLLHLQFTIVCPSNWMKAIVKKSFLKEKKTVVINNGINKRIFYKRNGGYFSGLFPDKIILLSVANVWNKDKGLNDFCELSNMLPNNYIIVLVGIKKKRLKKYKNIYCIERTNNQDELAFIYSSSDLFINLTYADTFPTVNLEAISCGLPVLTYCVGGSSEISTPGLRAKKGDLKEVYKIVLEKKYLELKQEINSHETMDCSQQFSKYLDLILEADNEN